MSELTRRRLTVRRARPGMVHLVTEWSTQKAAYARTLCGRPVDEENSRAVEEEVDCPTCLRLSPKIPTGDLPQGI
jgi:hypothetical protein